MNVEFPLHATTETLSALRPVPYLPHLTHYYAFEPISISLVPTALAWLHAGASSYTAAHAPSLSRPLPQHVLLPSGNCIVLTSPIALQDSFEDAQDTVPDTSSIRSLTRRTSPNPKPQPAEPESNHDKEQPQDDQKSTHAPEPEVNNDGVKDDTKHESQDVDNTTPGEDNDQSLAQPGRPSISPSQRLSLASNGQLAEVSLDDEAPQREKGSCFAHCSAIRAVLTVAYKQKQKHKSRTSR